MEIKNIQRIEDIKNIQEAIDLAIEMRSKVNIVLKRNKRIDSKNEFAVGFIINAKESLEAAVVELSNAISDIVGIDIHHTFEDSDNHKVEQPNNTNT